MRRLATIVCEVIAMSTDLVLDLFELPMRITLYLAVIAMTAIILYWPEIHRAILYAVSPSHRIALRAVASAERKRREADHTRYQSMLRVIDAMRKETGVEPTPDLERGIVTAHLRLPRRKRWWQWPLIRRRHTPAVGRPDEEWTAEEWQAGIDRLRGKPPKNT